MNMKKRMKSGKKKYKNLRRLTMTKSNFHFNINLLKILYQSNLLKIIFCKKSNKRKKKSKNKK